MHCRTYKILYFFPIVLLIFSSCTIHKKAVYFPAIKDSAQFTGVSAPEPVIKKTDLLSISVTSANQTATEIFNLPNVSDVQSSTQNGGIIRPAGYLVGQDGSFRFPQLGIIKAEGLTKKQLQEKIQSDLSERKLLLDPIVDIRQLNFKVSILGEVTRPTVIAVSDEKITLLEALSLAGDMTIFGKRDNVLVIREVGDKKVVHRINLNSNQIFTSPFYYLQSNDVVYVEPNKSRVLRESKLFQLLPVILSGLSTSIFLIDRVRQ